MGRSREDRGVEAELVPEEPLIQRYWYKGSHPERPKLVTRSYTKNAKNPSPAQAKQRLRVSDIARNARGKKMKKGDKLPPVARLVREFGTGPTGIEGRENIPVWKKELLDYVDSRTGTKSEKDRMLEEINDILERVGA